MADLVAKVGGVLQLHASGTRCERAARPARGIAAG